MSNAHLDADKVFELLEEYAESRSSSENVWDWWSESGAAHYNKDQYLKERGVQYASYWDLPSGSRERADAEKAADKYWKELRKLKTEDFLPDVPGLGTVETIEQFGGEGQGDQYWFVLKVTDHDGSVRHFKMNGWYASHDGGYYDGPFVEVKPVDRVVTFYE